MFRKNDDHLQLDLFSHYQTMNPSIARLLEKSWAPVFYEQVFCKINEELFAPLYSLDNGRPNFPVNILLSLEIIKNLFDYTDQELLEQFYFNYQVLYAVGIKNIGTVYFAERTLYEFRERLYQYIKEHPEEEDILFNQFEILTQHFIEVSDIDTHEQRMDSTFISPNIKKAGRLSLAHDVLAQAVRAIPQQYLSDALKAVLDSSFKNNLLYHTHNRDLDTRFQSILDLMTEIDKLKYPDIASLEAVVILKRFLEEQADYNQQEQRFIAKDKHQISSNSLQSAYDGDATYRDKAGKKNYGYLLNLAETCSDKNDVQLITDYKLAPNNKSDVEMIDNRMEPIKKKTDATDIYVDGGFYGEKVIEKAKGIGINLKFTDMTGRKAPSDKLPLSDFTFNENLEVIQCPNKQVPLRSNYSESKKASTSHFSKDICQECPLRPNCPVKNQKTNTVLRVSKKAIQAAEVRKEISKKEIKRQNTSKRAAIEGTNSALKRSEGAGNLRVRGLVKCSMVMSFKIMGHNFKQVYRGLKGLIRKRKPGIVCPNPS